MIFQRGLPKVCSSLLLFAMVASLCSPVPLRADNPPQKIDVNTISHRVDDVVIPVPSEIFNALDKMGGSPNWNNQIAPITKAKPKTQPDAALLLGTAIANGFIAVQAKDANRVKDIGKQVLDLSFYLGVRDDVISHCNSINDAADHGKWEAIRSEFDKAQNSVRSAMDRIKSKDLSELISIGGWLRGTDALTSLVQKDYSADRAELLHQPELLQTFGKQLGDMDARVKGNQTVVKVKESLNDIKPCIESSTPDPKQVDKVNSVTTGLLKQISPP